MRPTGLPDRPGGGLRLFAPEPDAREEADSAVSAARAMLTAGADALKQLASRLAVDFSRAVQMLAECPGTVVLSGVGKAGLIAQKLVATFCSVSLPARFLHPTDAVHGDLGAVRAGDVAMLLSNSGETAELLRLLPCLAERQVRSVAVTSRADSTLGKECAAVVAYGSVTEAGPCGLAPTTSTLVMLALGDALALLAAQARGLTPQQFGANHPGGSLGLQLRTVREAMRTGSALRLARQHETIRSMLASQSRQGRRTGAVMLVDDDGRLAGLFTDSDLVRLLEARKDDALDRPAAEVMTRGPKTAWPEQPLSEAIRLMSDHHISEIPVVDEAERPVGLLDITDLIGLGR
uniref:KpsF/GutQ family sugar-phosphate isomerase n=1 Tax=Schlesneria paludicola TaxID=360056 RepID=A0A7C2K0A5_9PLAN